MACITRRRLLAIAISCSATMTSSFPSPAATSVSVSELRKVPASVSVSSAVLRLQAEAWRDFMPRARTPTDPPGAPDGGRPMAVFFQLIHAGPRPTQPLHARTVWVLQGDSVWETSAIQQSGDALDDVKMWVGGGPYWSPRSHVDVIVRFTDDQGKTFDLAARDQLIQASS